MTGLRITILVSGWCTNGAADSLELPLPLGERVGVRGFGSIERP
jgi:hypothetical protein